VATTDMTFDEALDSLTGYDELGVKQAAGMPLNKLLSADEIHAIRCVVAVVEQRKNGKPGSKGYAEAYKAAMGLTLKDVRTYFAEAAEEFDPSDPDSESGKGD
jgi:hypothetical protein